MSTVTPFQSSVYDALRLIPRGKVTTYRELAIAVNCGSCRAVGQALRRNPFAPDVPCHRVIQSDLSLGGFSGQRTGATVRKKEALLKEEGVEFVDGRLVDRTRLFVFPHSSCGSYGAEP